MSMLMSIIASKPPIGLLGNPNHPLVDKFTALQLYNSPKLPGLTELVDQVESNFAEKFGFNTWNDYIDVVTSSPDATLLPVGLELENLPENHPENPKNLDDPEDLNDHKRVWVEQAPLNRNDSSLEFLSKFIYGEGFDLDTPDLQERFEQMLMTELNPDLSVLWNPFVETVLRLNNSLPEDFCEGDDFPVTPELAKNFCDHALLWAYVHNVPLLDPTCP